MKPASQEAVDLIHRGSIALAQIERNGIRIDRRYLVKQIKKTAKKIRRIEEELRDHEIYTIWRKRFGPKTNLGSNRQLGTIIFDVMGYQRKGGKTESDQESNDRAEFEGVDEPFVKKWFECEELKKANGTYLLGIERELDYDDFVHPIFNLNTAITFRSSSERPNFQNQPTRNPKIAEIVRRCYISRPGFRIGEIDYKAIEVAISACHHKDPNMIKYIEDSSTDMHRDMSMECFMLKEKQVSKMVRSIVKNSFVFPEFYGSYFMDCSRNMWDAIDLYDLQTNKGTPLKKHLKKKGIKSLGEKVSNYETGRIETKKGTFVEHIRQVERQFWDKRFKRYRDWKQEWWEKYLKRGWFRFKTGFISQGAWNWKQVCNSPIQGDAFLCTLWSLSEIQNWLNRKRLKTVIIGEIHDAIGFDFYEPEIDMVLKKAKYIMTEKIRQHWKWINVPLEIAAEIAPVAGVWGKTPEGSTWFEKEHYEI